VTPFPPLSSAHLISQFYFSKLKNPFHLTGGRHVKRLLVAAVNGLFFN
jgi:hypothetical protein